jgi:hypothetical protein
MDWSDLTPPPPGNAESIYCQCGAFAGPGADEVMPMEDAVAQGLCVDPADQFDSRGKRRFPVLADMGGFPVLLPDGERVQAKSTPNAAGGVDISITVGDAREIGRGSEVINEAIRRELKRTGRLPGIPGPHTVEEVYVGDVKVWPEPTPPGASEMDDDAKRKAEAERVAKAMGW